MLFSFLLGLTACKPNASESSKDCIQASNRVSVYTKSLDDLHELYENELDSDEAKRRISGMKHRIEKAKSYINVNCGDP